MHQLNHQCMNGFGQFDRIATGRQVANVNSTALTMPNGSEACEWKVGDRSCLLQREELAYSSSSSSSFISAVRPDERQTRIKPNTTPKNTKTAGTTSA